LSRTWPRVVLMIANLVGSPAAYAGHPMLSEDTGTQGRGNFELELGHDWFRSGADRGFLFQPQLSYGVSPALDLIVQPSWIALKDADGQRQHGFGDTNLDAKWRFFGAAPWSLGIRAGVELSTAQDNLGLAPGKDSPHGILVATFDAAPLTLDLNLGYTHAPGDVVHRSNLYHLSAAATFGINERLFCVVDTSLDSNPDMGGSNYQRVVLVGAIFTVHPGLDVDAGYRSRMGAVGPVQQWLLGITFRGAP
jgi:hypothetical protein